MSLLLRFVTPPAATTWATRADGLLLVPSPFVPADVTGGRATKWASGAVVAAILAELVTVTPGPILAPETFATRADVAPAAPVLPGPGQGEAIAPDTISARTDIAPTGLEAPRGVELRGTGEAAADTRSVGADVTPPALGAIPGIEALPPAAGAGEAFVAEAAPSVVEPLPPAPPFPGIEVGEALLSDVGPAPVAPSPDASLVMGFEGAGIALAELAPEQPPLPPAVEVPLPPQGDTLATGAFAAPSELGVENIPPQEVLPGDTSAFIEGLGVSGGLPLLPIHPEALLFEGTAVVGDLGLEAKPGGAGDVYPGQPRPPPLDWIITEIIWEGEPEGEVWEWIEEPLQPLQTWAEPLPGVRPEVEAPPLEPVPPVRPRPRPARQVRVRSGGRAGVTIRECRIEIPADPTQPRRILCRKSKYGPWRPAGFLPPEQPPPVSPPRPPPIPPVVPPPIPPVPPQPPGATPFPPLAQPPPLGKWLSKPKNVGKLIKWGKWAWLAIKIVAEDDTEDD